MVFKNIRLFLLGSEVYNEGKLSAAQDLNSALEAGWPGLRLPNEFHFQRLLGLTNLRTSGAARAGCRHPVTNTRHSRRLWNGNWMLILRLRESGA
jgi:hypothetical protein